jgi:NADH dehydrogenase
MPKQNINSYIPESDKKRVIVIGGGFAGINFIRNLDKKRFQIVLIDKHNHHTFQPLLYQVATAGLGPGAIASSLRNHFGERDNFHFRLAEVVKIDTTKKKVHTKRQGNIGYDYLVLATGSKANFFGNEGIEKNAFKLKQITDALAIRERFLQNFEQALLNTDVDMESVMNVVVAGAGPTGVEVSGAIAELRNKVLPKDYPELDLTKMRIILVEGENRLLPSMTQFSSDKAEKYLEGLKVETRLDTLVESYDGDEVKLSSGETIKSQLLIWSAGVQGSALEGFDEKLIKRGTYEVDDINRIKGLEDVFAVGDTAFFPTPEYPKGLPMVAPVAIQQGKHLAKNLNCIVKGAKPKPFKYFDKGYMATMGRNKAVVETPFKLKFGGRLGWLAWVFVHLMSIIGAQNKLVTLGYWAYNYFTFNKGNRLLIQSSAKKNSVGRIATKREETLHQA